MSGNFEKAVAVILAHETGGRADGGYTNDPKDPGGETRWGISKRFNPSVDVRNLTRAQAEEIYRQKYWLPLRCDEMPYAVALHVFDAAVNPGQGWAAKALQAALGVATDGRLGNVTMAALAKADALAVCEELAAQRQVYFALRPTAPRFGLGWARRVVKTHSYALGAR